MRLITSSYGTVKQWDLDETYSTAQNVLDNLNRGIATEIDTTVEGYKGVNRVTINPAQLEWWGIVDEKDAYGVQMF